MNGIEEHPPERPEWPQDVAKIKLDINNLVWMYAHPNTTLAEADEIAMNIFGMLLRNPRSKPQIKTCKSLD
jgi:hypothetical protein